MQLNQLSPNAGSRPKRVRKGRGIGSTLGKTSGRGHKGQKARSGGGVRPGFEGGQMPIFRRLPKRGFKNVFGKEIIPVALGKLDCFEDGTVVTEELLYQTGIVNKKRDGLKILADGELTKQLTVQIACSKAAAAKIEAVGGKVEVK